MKLTTYTISCNRIAKQCIERGNNKKQSFLYAKKVIHANIQYKRMIRIKNLIIR